MEVPHCHWSEKSASKGLWNHERKMTETFIFFIEKKNIFFFFQKITQRLKIMILISDNLGIEDFFSFPLFSFFFFLLLS